MKKVLLAMLAFAVVFTGCNDDENCGRSNTFTVASGPITGDDMDDITSVRAYYDPLFGPLSFNLAATGEFTNNRFTIELPREAARLNNVVFADYPFFPNVDAVVYSAPSVNMMSVDFAAYNAANNRVGVFAYQGEAAPRSFFSYLVYLDSDLQITGTYYHDEVGTIVWSRVFEIDAKKGWNWIYETQEEKVVTIQGTQYTIEERVYSVTAPEGVSMNWQFYPNPVR